MSNRFAADRIQPPTLSGIFLLAFILGSLIHPPGSTAAMDIPWKRHTIDASSRGADGVRLTDVNGDGLPDITTGWEEGGVVRVYLHPGVEKAKQLWPAVTVGNVKSVEDAVFMDVDADGAVDVVSSCEGNTKSLFVHWAPSAASRYLQGTDWKTESLPAAQDAMQWMFSLPLQIDGKHGLDLVAGGKNRNAQIGWWQAPAHPRQLADWKWHPLGDAGWIMSLIAEDMDGDGDLDVLATDRRGATRGCFWLENPSPDGNPEGEWRRHSIGGDNLELMFLSVTDLDQDGLRDVLVAAKLRAILFFRRLSRDGQQWTQHSITIPENAGHAKAVQAGDIDLNGRLDLVFTCEGADKRKDGVMWLSYRQSPLESEWAAHVVSGPEGVKFDLVELLDLDADGDLDAVTCEERDNLGVFWYENPIR